MNQDVVLSVICITFNHRKYIESAIKGFLNQETNFSIEIIIADDCSTDGTQEIIKKYYHKYPDKIIPILRKKNIGGHMNFIDTFNRCTGKYIAICEGDDCWTDTKKIQKQVDFLENNKDFAMTSHAVKTIFIGVEEKNPFCKPLEIATFEDIVTNKHYIPTLSIVFRNDALNELPYWFRNLWVGDIPLVHLITLSGKNYYFMEVMGLKRKHTEGLTQKSGRNNSKFKNYVNINKLYFYKKLDNYSNYKYHKLLKPKIGIFHIMAMYIYFENKQYLKGFWNIINAFYYSPIQLIQYFIRYLRKETKVR